jgi:hypothetical protein
MSLRIPGFILAAALLVGDRLIKPRTQPSELADRWNLARNCAAEMPFISPVFT